MKMSMFLRGNEGIPVNQVIVAKAEGSWALGVCEEMTPDQEGG